MNNLEKERKPQAESDSLKVDFDNEDFHRMLRAENAAVEAYRQLLLQWPDAKSTQQLETLLEDHVDAVRFWSLHISGPSQIIDASSGVWGKVSETLAESDSAMALELAVGALKTAEEFELNEYSELLEHASMPAEVKKHISHVIIPCQRQHVEDLDGILSNGF